MADPHGVVTAELKAQPMADVLRAPDLRPARVGPVGLFPSFGLAVRSQRILTGADMPTMIAVLAVVALVEM